MANGSPDEQLGLEAARKRLKIERATSESECPLDAQIRRMQKELEELKKKRQVAELQEQILAEQQLLQASRHRLSIAAASVSPKSSPVPASVLSTPAVPTPPVPRFAPQTPQAVVTPTIERNNSPPTRSLNVSQTPVPSQPVPVQQSQPPRLPPQAPKVQASPTVTAQATNGQALAKAPAQALGVQAQISPAGVKRESNNTPNQVQTLSTPKVGNGIAPVQAQRPNGVAPSIPKQQGQQQQQEQRPWFDRPRTPGAPENAALEQLGPYQGRSRDEYTKFVSVLEAHFAKSPQYYSKDREYRQVKLGLQHLAPAQRDNWYALPDRNDSWQNFRAFLLKEVVRNSKFMARSAGAPQPPAPEVEKTQNPTATQMPPAMQPPQASSNTPKVPPQHSAQQSPQAPPNHSFSLSNRVSGSGDLTPPRAKAVAAEAFAAYYQSQQKPGQTVKDFSEWLQSLGLLLEKDLSLHDRMSYLKKGVVASVRNRAHRPFSYFKSYDEYLLYLQDIEDTLPQRQVELKGQGLPQSPFKTGSSWVPVSRDEKPNNHTARQPSIAPRGRSPVRGGTVQGNNQKGPQTPASSGARSHATPGHLPPRPDSGPASPTSRKSVARRMSSPAPPEPKLSPTDGKDYWACRNYIKNLELHFKEYQQYYNEERKVAAGRRLIAPCLRGEWNAYAGKHQRMTWFDVCAFICNQAARKIQQRDAVRQYLHTNQKPHQNVRDFALWVQMYAPHCTRPGWDELRHLWDRISSDIRKRASKDFKDFKDLAAFVTYLEAVERTSPNTPKDHGSQNTLLPEPRKRGRAD